MGSFVTLDLQSLSSLLEACHNCPSGKAAEVSITENLTVRVGVEVIRPITFLCCGLIISSEGAIFWHSEDITSDSISNSSSQEKTQESPADNTEVIPEKSRDQDIEDVIVKCEERLTEKIVENDDDVPKTLAEVDPLLVDASSSGTQSSVTVSKPFTSERNSHADTHPKVFYRQNLSSILNDQDSFVVTMKAGKDTSIKNVINRYPETFICEYCGMTFQGRNHAYKFYHHRNRVHTKERVFKCDICLKDFYGDRSLISHMNIHKNPKFVCHICGKALSTKKHLKTHLLIHDSVRDHKCEFCGKKFRRKDHLTVHERIHTGDRPHQCKSCGSAYPQKLQLNLHIRKCPYFQRDQGLGNDETN